MNKQEILKELELQRLVQVQKTSAMETFMKTHHLTKISDNQLSIDIDAYKNNISSEQDDDICDFLKEHNMTIARMDTGHVYKDHYMLFYELPGYLKGWKSDECKNNRIYTGPFKGDIHVHLSNRTWLGTYNNTLTLNSSDMRKVATVKDVLEEVLDNFERCLCLKDCDTLMMQVCYLSDHQKTVEDLNGLKERIMISPIRYISFVQGNDEMPVYYNFENKLEFPDMKISDRVY